MRPLATILLCCALPAGLRAQGDLQVHRDSCEAYWGRIEAAFADSATSPLRPADRAEFQGIDRFPYAAELRVVARFKPAERPRIFKMRTSTSREPLYRPYGTLTFQLLDQEHVLTVYQNVELLGKEGFEDYLFLPFTDRTNGESTYGGGRYLDLKAPLGAEVVVDLNEAYNPYCAYNERYSCPVPPRENHLELEVKAGARKFHD